MIDWNHVDELEQQLGPGGLDEVLAIFLEETAPVIDGLRPDADTLAADLHFIKGSAANMGFIRLMRHCEAGGAQVQAGEPVDIAAIAECFTNSCREFRERKGAIA